jgi:hypothetical protein
MRMEIMILATSSTSDSYTDLTTVVARAWVLTIEMGLENASHSDNVIISHEFK